MVQQQRWCSSGDHSPLMAVLHPPVPTCTGVQAAFCEVPHPSIWPPITQACSVTGVQDACLHACLFHASASTRGMLHACPPGTHWPLFMTCAHS